MYALIDIVNPLKDAGAFADWQDGIGLEFQAPLRTLNICRQHLIDGGEELLQPLVLPHVPARSDYLMSD